MREFTLAIGSDQGGITMYDTQTKQKLFYDEKAHQASVRDISMFESPDVFVSCSYDSKINVYDLRTDSIVQQHKQDYPLSCVCVTSCGKSCVAGNLKGDIIAFDFRNLKDALNTKRIYNSAVTRVAFIASTTSNVNSIHDSYVSANSDFVTSLYKSVSSVSSASISHQSSGLESFDTCQRNNSTIVDDVTPKRRDSWADLMPVQKVHDFSMDSMAETPSRMSMGVDFQSDSQIMFQSRYSAEQSMNLDPKNHIEQIIPEVKITQPKERREKHVIEPKRRRMTEVMALEGIEEEDASEMNQLENCSNNTNSNDKKWLHTVDHKQFADGFAAYVKTVFDENNTVSTKINSPARQSNVGFEEGISIDGCDLFCR